MDSVPVCQGSDGQAASGSITTDAGIQGGLARLGFGRPSAGVPGQGPLESGRCPAGQAGEPVKPDLAWLAGILEVAVQVARAKVVGAGQPADIGGGAFAGDRSWPDRERPQRMPGGFIRSR